MTRDSRSSARRALLCVLGLLLALPAAPAAAVILDGANQCTVKLRDGTDVVLYGEFKSKLGGGTTSCVSQRGVEDDETPRLSALSGYRQKGFLDALEGGVATRSGGTESGETKSAAMGSSLRDSAASARQQYTSQGAKDFREHKKTPCFYYLPPGNSLRLSKRKDGNPEFLFVKYTSDESEEEGGVQGGLLHFLMEWRLTQAQERDLRRQVKKSCKVTNSEGTFDGVLVGAAELSEADEDEGSFRIISATLSDEGFTRSMVQSGHAPTMPGGKVAAAANMTAKGAALFLASLEQGASIADLSVELDFKYNVQLPAAKGEIIFNWDRLQITAEEYSANFESTNDEHGKWDADDNELVVSEEETQAFFDYMVENSVVEFVFEGYNPDSEYTAKIMDAMMEYFLNSMMKPAEDVSMLMGGDDEDEGGEDNRPEQLGRRGTVNYTIDRSAWSEKYATKKQVIRLDAGLAVKRRFQVVGNMASWYNSVRGKACCIQSVNLSDPFFKQRELRFILDLDAKDMFDEMVNYVTVQVKKRRNKGNDFTDAVTIDADHLANRGIMASLTYAQGDDRNPEMYQYQTQWSIRGGNLFPARPRWIKGTYEGVTLSPPIEEWYVEVEGDLAQMTDSDIARITVELHYPLFGQEEFTVIPLSPRAGEDLVGQKIYVDRGTRGFAYRLIAHHKTEGRMVTDWTTRVGDRYVYAALPEDILVAGDPREQAKAAARKLGKIGAEKVLDKFKELFATAD